MTKPSRPSKDREPNSRGITRRTAIGTAGAAGAALLLGRGALELVGTPGFEQSAQAASCVLTPEKTEGPYFVDERLNRSDIRSNSDGSGTREGVPLELTINVIRVDEDCAPAAGVVVDVWHADAEGSYSDVSQNGTVGQDFLRGLQVTDSDGSATFTTIYPGWYSGRTIHIHFKVRTFEDDGQTYEFTSQLFFADATNTAVVATDAYDDRGAQDTTNGEDGIYGGDTDLLVPLSGSATAGFSGEITVGLTGLPDTGSGGSDGDDVDASLLATRIERRRDGARVLVAQIDADERVAVRLRLRRRRHLLAKRDRRSLEPGRHTIRARLDEQAAAGKAQLRVAIKDRAGNVRRIRRRLRIPAAR